MNENGTKRREWVKTAAIIFLSVLLVLTFFSNTIMNYSLPEVAAQYVESGSITAKIRGTGMIESDDPYEVKIKQTRTIESVKVKAGDMVEKGDVLFELKDEESEELDTARTELETARLAYDNMVKQIEIAYLTGAISHESYSDLVTGSNMSFAECLKMVTDINAELDGYEKKSADLALRIDQLNTKKNNLQYSTPDITKETKEYHDAEVVYNQKLSALDSAKAKLTSLTAELEEAQKLINNVNNGFITVTDGDSSELTPEQLDVARKKAEILPGQISEIQKQVAALENETYAAEVEKDKKKNALDAKANQTQSNQQLEKEIANLTIEQTANAAKLETRTQDRAKLYEEITIALGGNASYDLTVPQSQVDAAMKKVAKLEAESVGATVTAPISGTISNVPVTAGKTVNPDEVLATMQPEGRGYTMSFSVTNEQARRLSVGDRAELVNSWRYDDVEVVLDKIKADPTEPGQKKLLTFTVSGDVMAGQSLSVSVGQKSADYDLIVPNSAIREDNNGKFILIVEAKNSPLGTRYTATRVDIEVIASDDTKSAISGGLYGYEFVITTSTKPVEAGKLVRLADE